MTHIFKGTLGDYHAGRRLVLLLKESFPQFKVQWIFFKDEQDQFPKDTFDIADSVLVKNISQQGPSAPYEEDRDLLKGSWINDACYLIKKSSAVRFPAQLVSSLPYLLAKKTKLVTLIENDGLEKKYFLRAN